MDGLFTGFLREKLYLKNISAKTERSYAQPFDKLKR